MTKENSVFKFSDFVGYQENSIVSREIIKKPTGSITLFAFDKGQGLSEHKAPFDAFVYIIDGAAEIKLSGKEYRLKRGEMIIMPANEPHELKAAKEKFKMALVIIKS